MKKERIEKLFAATIGNYIKEHISLIDTPALMSVVKVKVAPSLDLAQVYVSFITQKNAEQDEATLLQSIMTQHHWKIKQYLARKLGKHLRRIPAELRFYRDYSAQNAYTLEKLLQKTQPDPSKQ